MISCEEPVWITETRIALHQLNFSRLQITAAIELMQSLECENIPEPYVSPIKVRRSSRRCRVERAVLLSWIGPRKPDGKWDGLFVVPMISQGRVSADMTIIVSKRVLWAGWQPFPVQTLRSALGYMFRNGNR